MNQIKTSKIVLASVSDSACVGFSLEVGWGRLAPQVVQTPVAQASGNLKLTELQDNLSYHMLPCHAKSLQQRSSGFQRFRRSDPIPRPYLSNLDLSTYWTLTL